MLSQNKDASGTGVPETDLSDVTVVIPVWGSYAILLPQVIQSLLNQEPQPQVIVIDNASEPPIVSLSGVQLVRLHSRATVGAARTAALMHVATEFTVFWDVDDVMLPGTLRKLHNVLVEEPDVVAAATRILEAEGRFHHWPRMRAQVLSRWPHVYALVHCVSSLYPTTGSVLIRTAALQESGGFPDVNEGDDWAAGVTLALRGRVVLLDTPGRIYRIHSGSISRRWRVSDRLHGARNVRDHLRRDRRVSPWVRALVPLLVVPQWFVLLGLRSLRLGSLLLKGRRHRRSDRSLPDLSSE